MFDLNYCYLAHISIDKVVNISDIQKLDHHNMYMFYYNMILDLLLMVIKYISNNFEMDNLVVI